MKKIIVLAGSPRKQSSSHALARALVAGAAEKGAETEIIEVAQTRIMPCQGCNYCLSHDGICRISDDMTDVLSKIEAADAVVLATPLYFRSFSAQLKGCIDRMYCRYHAKTIGGKTCALLVTSGNNSRESTQSFFTIYRDLISLLDWQDEGIVWAGGCGSGDFVPDERFDSAVQKASELGSLLGS